MKTALISYALDLLLKALTPQLLKEVVDDMLDTIEAKDKTLAAACSVIRTAFNIPDDIGGDPD